MYWHIGQFVGALILFLGLSYGAGVLYAMARAWINDKEYHYREDVKHPIYPFDFCEFEWGDRVEAAILVPLGMTIVAIVSVPLWPITVGVLLIVSVMIHLRHEKRKAKS